MLSKVKVWRQNTENVYIPDLDIISKYGRTDLSAKLQISQSLLQGRRLFLEVRKILGDSFSIFSRVLLDLKLKIFEIAEFEKKIGALDKEKNYRSSSFIIFDHFL